MANQASAELFLDILTKEEKEALLSKKMEEIRKKNEALRRRHEEIQKDKKSADQVTKDTSDSSSKSPTKEKQSFSNDNKQNDRPKKNTGKPMGRGKPRPKSGGDYNPVQNEHQFKHETPKRFSFGEQDRPNDFRFGEHDDRDADYRTDRRSSNHRNFRGRGGRGGNNDNYNRQDSRSSNEGNFRNSGDFSRQDSRGRGRGRNSYDRQDSRSSGEDNFRNSGDFSRSDSRGRGNQSKRQGYSNRYSGEFKRNNYQDKREQYDDDDGNRKRPFGGSHYHDERVEGPPPDPAYNFLSDRAREGFQNQERKEPPKRHPKNFGGQDFSNVKNQMKNVKERQQNRSGPPKSKMEMTVTMTGKERRQYMEWKADRDRVDNARIERQKSSSGEWKREWDKEKIELEQTEPARRPVGRIGSGRFDRGDDERKKGQNTGQLDEHTRGNPDKSPTKQRGDIQPKGRGVNRHPETPPRMAGRGRGRGKAKSANEAKPQRMRTTSSGDERVVNCHSDLLVIKLENTPGDNSVEVEYSDGEVPVGKSPRGKPGAPGGGTATHGAQTEELWWDEDDDLTMSLVQDGLEEDDVLEHRQLFEDADQGAHSNQEIVVDEDEDEWEDCDDDSFYSKSQTSTDSREGFGQLKVNTQLNPDAPEFTPTSPLSPPSPRSPREKRQKIKHGEKSPGKKSEARVQKKGADKTQGTQPCTKPTQRGTANDSSGSKITNITAKNNHDETGKEGSDGTNVSEKQKDNSKDSQRAEGSSKTDDIKVHSADNSVDNIDSLVTEEDSTRSDDKANSPNTPVDNTDSLMTGGDSSRSENDNAHSADTSVDNTDSLVTGGDSANPESGDQTEEVTQNNNEVKIVEKRPGAECTKEHICSVDGTAGGSDCDGRLQNESKEVDTTLNGDIDTIHDSGVDESIVETATDTDETVDSSNIVGAEGTEQVAKTETTDQLRQEESTRTETEE